MLSQVKFFRNEAIGGAGANPGQGKGGALFIVTPELQSQAGVMATPRVRSLRALPTFMDNLASHALGTPTDNENVYGLLRIN
ncbi:hypothetical protein BST81_20115 [Leptolyngbya sp. 'hensonii']|nr:hypothetical protein BST81_20115 [Leptolyngbya sp. 'hensonii']